MKLGNNVVSVCLVLLGMLLLEPVLGQTAPSYLKPGDRLPPLAGKALTGKWLDIASVFGGNPGVVVFSFSRAGGRDAQLCTQRLMKDDPHMAIYNVIFLESVPVLFRAMAVSAIKDGMPLVPVVGFIRCLIIGFGKNLIFLTRIRRGQGS